VRASPESAIGKRKLEARPVKPLEQEKFRSCARHELGHFKMGLFDFLKGENKGNKVKKTAGKCCIYSRNLFRNPDEADRLDNAARYCKECGTDICVDCLQKQEKNCVKVICPVCGKEAFFEINPLFRPL